MSVRNNNFMLPWLLWAVFVLLSLSVRSQTLNGAFIEKHYDQRNGLPTAFCASLYKDANGFLWIATPHGVSRFDGTGFKNYGIASGILPGPTGFFVTDREKRLYVLKRNKIYLWNPGRHKAFTVAYSSDTAIQTFIPLHKDTFYVSYRGLPGLYKVIRGQKRLVMQTAAPIVIFAAEADFRRKYFSTADGKILGMDGDRPTGEIPVPVSQGWPLQFAEDLTGNIWVAGNRLAKLSAEGITDSLPLPPDTLNIGTQIAFTGARSYYAMTGWNLYQFNGTRLSKMAYTGPKGLSNITPNCLIMDAEQQPWFGTQQGLYRLSVPPFRTEHMTVGRYYLSSDRNGKMTINFDSSLLRLPELSKSEQDLKGKYFGGIFKDRSGQLWHLAIDGVYRYGTDGKMIGYKSDTTGPLSNRAVAAMVENAKGELWTIGPTHLGLLKGNTIEPFAPVYSGGMQTCVFDRDNRIWAMTGKGLYCYNGTGFDRPELPSQLKDKKISIQGDQKKNLWISTGNAFYTIGKKGKGIAITDSLFPPPLYAESIAEDIQFDRHGNLWAAYNNGILILLVDEQHRYSNTRYIFLGPDDGIAELMAGKYAQLLPTGDGNICLFYQPSAILYADALLNSYNRPAPKPYFTGLELFNKEVNWETNGVSTDTSDMPIDLQLPYDKNFLSFRFSSIGFHNAESFSYQYRLEDVDMDWQTAGIERRAAYTNLPPGKYRFLLRAANENGRWSQPVAYTFSILAPWYDRWWARSLWVLMAAGAMYALFTIRKRAALRKMRMEQMVTEQKLVALRAQINPHALQNTFNFLALKVHYEQYKDSLIDAIHKVSRYFRSVLDKSDHTIITLEEEIDFSEDYLSMQQTLLEDRFAYTFDVDDNIDTQMIKVPSMLLQPILENAIRYSTEKDNKGDIRISASEQDDQYIILEVRDNGPGKPKKEGQEQPKMSFGRLHQSKGMRITQDKLTLTYQACRLRPSIELLPNAGTPGHTVRIRIPLQ